MSRSGYTECDGLDQDDLLQAGRWQGQVASAIRGRRGQRFLRDLAQALDALPERKLIRGMVEQDGCVCALGALGRHRGVDLLAGWREDAAREAERHGVDPDEVLAEHLDANGIDWCEGAAAALDVAHQLVAEVVFWNDDGIASTDEERWREVRRWVERNLRAERSER